jgi:hypothetical protein
VDGSQTYIPLTAITCHISFAITIMEIMGDFDIIMNKKLSKPSTFVTPS